MYVPFTVQATETFKVPEPVMTSLIPTNQFWITCSSDKLGFYVFHQAITKTNKYKEISLTLLETSFQINLDPLRNILW